MDFAERLSRRMQELRMRPARVAVACDVDQRTVERWMNGSSYPRWDMIRGLREVLDVDYDWLFEEDAAWPQSPPDEDEGASGGGPRRGGGPGSGRPSSGGDPSAGVEATEVGRQRKRRRASR